KSEHEERQEGYYRLERSTGSFSRSLTLPEGVDPEKVQASFDKGVLEVRIPKPEQRKPRKVTIAAGGASKTIEGAETSSSTEAGAEVNSDSPVGAGA
ncbi:MAG: Hsp20/alpha crystallin family protein, partial [Solirubrobacterales bacterium]|nr:Hsp20/alpha crystallin family protein [Solirubrobacterales bacterium]